MHRFYLAPLIAALMLGLTCAPAYAIGDVLVPTDDDTPSASDKTPAPSSSTEETAPVATEAPVSLLNPDAASNLTPIPAAAPPMLPASGPLVIQKPPTQIIKMAAAANSSYDPQDKTLTNTLNVSLQDYRWGPGDIALVSQGLGIPAGQVAKNCSLEAVGTLLSDAVGFVFDLKGPQAQSVLHYSGKPSGITVMTRAMCDAVQLPANAGVVLQIGDKYAVFMAQTQCPPPPTNARNLAFQYTGNGKAQCAYE